MQLIPWRDCREIGQRLQIRTLLGVTTIIVLALPMLAYAQTITPFYNKNYSPFVFIHGLPYTGEATVLANGESRTHIIYAAVSHYAIEVDNNAGEKLLIDGESSHFAFSYERGIGNSFQLGILIPYVRHDAGSMDSFINDWHQTFNLPEGGRDIAPNDKLRFYYEKNGEVKLDYNKSHKGIGDISISAAYDLNHSGSPHTASALAMSLKIPTGDSDALLGSGAFDFATWYKHERKTTWFGLPSGYFYSAGFLLAGKGDLLPEMQNTGVLLAGGGLGMKFGQYLSFKTQLDYHSKFYSDSVFNELGGNSLQLVLGGTLHFTKTIQLDLGLAEDLIIDTAPDVVFHADLAVQF